MKNEPNYQNFKIELNPKEDKDLNLLYFAKIKAPMYLSFAKGIAFFVFLSEDGAEEMHISCARHGSACPPLKKKTFSDGSIDRYLIKLEKRIDENDNPYYFALARDEQLELDLSQGYLFFIFTSKLGKEEIQIMKDKETKYPEIVRSKKK